MPIVVAQGLWRHSVDMNFGVWLDEIEDKFLLPIEYIAKRYEQECVEGARVHCYVSRIFNEEFEFINRPRKYCELDLLAVGKNYKMCLDLSDLADELSLPSPCIVELLAIAFVGDEESDDKKAVIFPFELRIDAIKRIRKQVEAELEPLKEIAGMFEQHSFYDGIGLGRIAEELGEGYTKYKEGDADGSIIAYRNAVEGLRNLFSPPTKGRKRTIRPNTIDQDEKRTEKLAGFLSSVFDVLSNFGEHYGTKASDEEATLSRKLAENVSEYVSKKLRKQQGTKAG